MKIRFFSYSPKMVIILNMMVAMAVFIMSKKVAAKDDVNNRTKKS